MLEGVAMMGWNGSDRAVLARGLCCLVLTAAAAAALVSLPTPHRAIAAGADCRRRGARRRAIVVLVLLMIRSLATSLLARNGYSRIGYSSSNYKRIVEATKEITTE